MFQSLVVRALGALRTGWCLAGTTLVTLILAEGCGRIAFWCKDAIGRTNAPASASVPAWTSTPCLREAWAVKLHWQPYTYWRGSRVRGRCVTVESDGRRRTWQPRELDSGAPVIAMFGGSTMWGSGVRDDHTIASLLSRRLAEEGVAARVENHAQIGWVSTQSLLDLTMELRTGRAPRVAVFYEGWNDIASCFSQAAAGIPLNESNRELEFSLVSDPGRLRFLALSQLSKTAMGRLASALRHRLGGAPAPPTWSRAWAGLLGEDTPEARLDSVAREVVRVYEANVRMIELLGRSSGFRPLFYWQPNLFVKTTLTPAEQRFVRGQDLFGRFTRAVHRAIAESGPLRQDAAFRDLGSIFAGSPEEIFFDWSHVSEEANQRLAEEMVSDVRRALENRSAGVEPARLSP